MEKTVVHYMLRGYILAFIAIWVLMALSGTIGGSGRFVCTQIVQAYSCSFTEFVSWPFNWIITLVLSFAGSILAAIYYYVGPGKH